MAVISNVFWYINKAKWWVYASYSYKQLLSVSTAAEVVAILNTDPWTYYTTLNSLWHIYDSAIANEAWTGKYNWTDGTVVYSNGTWSVGEKSYRVFTVSWTEDNTPATVVNSVVYSDDAAGLTRWVSKEFDEFFGYYACRLSSTWTESEVVNQSYSWNTVNLPLWTLATATSGNDVMICFPKRGIKMTKSWSVVTLSITDEPDADWYQYYAFNKWVLNSSFGYSTSRPVDKFYLWAFECNTNCVSLPGQTLWSWTFSTYWSNAKAKSSDSSTKDSSTVYYNSNWSAMRWWQREYVNALYMMKYGNPNSQSQIWNGRVSWWSALSTGNSWSSNSSLATWWTTDNQTSSMRLFWLENWWGNVSEWCMGIKTYSSYNCKVNLWNDDWDTTVATTASYVDTWYGSAIWTNWRPATAIAWDNKWMFIATSVYSSQDWSVWYCDWSRVNSGYIADVGGYYSGGLDAGAFNLDVNVSPSFSGAHGGSRLVFL